VLQLVLVWTQYTAFKKVIHHLIKFHHASCEAKRLKVQLTFMMATRIPERKILKYKSQMCILCTDYLKLRTFADIVYLKHQNIQYNYDKIHMKSTVGIVS
jgi:hypothetical protein